MRYPEKDELGRIAQGLGFDLNESELEIMHDRAAKQMEALERLMNHDHGMTTGGPGRVEGIVRDWFVPSLAQDPYHAFISRCDIVADVDGGALAGMTFGLKDTIAVAGIPMSLGSRGLMHYVPEFDASVTKRLILAGARILGKLNMYAFSSGDAMGDMGRVLNPKAIGRETGGSSSGSAAAVAAGLVDVALGGDQGGSIRIPAAWCDVVGFKPSYGLVPHTGIFGGDPSVDHVGPMARSVEDIALVMDVLAGSDGMDNRQVGVLAAFSGFSETLEDGVSGLRVGILKEGLDPDEGVQALSIRTMVEALRSAGASVTEVSVPLHVLAGDAWLAIWLEGTWYMNQTFLGSAMHRGWYPESLMQAIGQQSRGAGHGLPYNYRQMVIMGAYLHERFFGNVYARCQNLRGQIMQAYDNAFKDVDLLILPTMSSPPPTFALGKTYRERVDLTIFGGGGLDLSEFVRNVSPFSYTGHPAISVPCGLVNNLPSGGQIVGKTFDDAMVLRAARVVEKWVTQKSSDRS